MTQELQRAFDRLETSGWRLIQNVALVEWPRQVTARYPWISSDLHKVLSELKEVVSIDETCWLLTTSDYAGNSESAFAWNEWEQQSIEAAGVNSEWTAQIVSFWDLHLPVALSVRDGYMYYALRKDGSVVSGREPEFEETTLVASTYAAFIAKLAE
jgi:hypothetical protein